MKNTKLLLALLAALAVLFAAGCDSSGSSSSSALAGTTWSGDSEAEFYRYNEAKTVAGTITLSFSSTAFTWIESYTNP